MSKYTLHEPTDVITDPRSNLDDDDLVILCEVLNRYQMILHTFLNFS